MKHLHTHPQPIIKLTIGTRCAPWLSVAISGCVLWGLTNEERVWCSIPVQQRHSFGVKTQPQTHSQNKGSHQLQGRKKKQKTTFNKPRMTVFTSCSYPGLTALGWLQHSIADTMLFSFNEQQWKGKCLSGFRRTCSFALPQCDFPHQYSERCCGLSAPSFHPLNLFRW